MFGAWLHFGAAFGIFAFHLWLWLHAACCAPCMLLLAV